MMAASSFRRDVILLSAHRLRDELEPRQRLECRVEALVGEPGEAAVTRE